MLKGLVSLDEMMASLPEERRKEIEIRGAELIAKVERRMARAERRKLSQTTQSKTTKAKTPLRHKPSP